MNGRLKCRKVPQNSEAHHALVPEKLFSYRPAVLPGSPNKRPRRKRWLVLPPHRAARLLGASVEKKQVLHVASLLLSARDALALARRHAEWLKAAQPPNVTWLD
jgi:hypothetical protein